MSLLLVQHRSYDTCVLAPLCALRGPGCRARMNDINILVSLVYDKKQEKLGKAVPKWLIPIIDNDINTITIYTQLLSPVLVFTSISFFCSWTDCPVTTFGSPDHNHDLHARGGPARPLLAGPAKNKL